MQPTKLLYLEDFSVLTCQASILETLQSAEHTTIILDQTVFYPQGGGQPYDQGTITNHDTLFQVSEVRFFDGFVHHIGTYESGTFHIGDEVICSVDSTRRTLLSKLHSGGHLVDMAVVALGLPWKPGKGYHFPDGANVEYEGSLEGYDKEILLKQIQDKANEFIAQDLPVTMQFMEKEKMSEVCHFVPDNLPINKPSRVILFGSFGVPCGGTHVTSLSKIGKLTIRKIKAEKGSIKVGYDVER